MSELVFTKGRFLIGSSGSLIVSAGAPSTAITKKIRSVTIAYDAEIHDKSAMGANSISRIAGLKDANMSVEFNQDFSSSDFDKFAFGLAGKQSNECWIQVTPTTSWGSPTNPRYCGRFISEEYTPIAGSVGDLMTHAIMFYSDGDLERLTTNDNPYLRDCVLLIHSDGPNGSQVFVDSSPIGHTIPKPGWPVADTHHDDIHAKFGSTSIYFDGTTDRIVIADSPSWDFGNNDFSIDFWIYPTNYAFSNLNMGVWNYSSGSRSWNIRFTKIGTPVYFDYSVDGSTVKSLIGTTNLAEEWNHVRITRLGATIYLAINGVIDNTYNCGTDTFYNPTHDLINFCISYYNDIAGETRFQGWLDEIYILKGRALSSGNFDVPTVPWGT